jgi:5-formyltetrahydrofolate cyclo-ligase
MIKSELRKAAFKHRNSLSGQEVTRLTLLLLERFKTFDFSNVRTVHLFLPIVEKKEPDTFLFIDWLRQQHPEILIIVPKADFLTSGMTHHLYHAKDELSKSSFNILEPVDSEHYAGAIDLVLIPLLAFDAKGYRVGYGKGFYDRFLKDLNTLKIGLSFFEASDPIEDVNEQDVGMDGCITPERIYTFL